MSTSATDHARFAQGLKDLAAFIESHTDLPIPMTADIYYSVCAETDQEEHAIVDRIAAILGTHPKATRGGTYYDTFRQFGPVIYRATSIASKEVARYRAALTYAESVTPDDE